MKNKKGYDFFDGTKDGQEHDFFNCLLDKEKVGLCKESEKMIRTMYDYVKDEENNDNSEECQRLNSDEIFKTYQEISRRVSDSDNKKVIDDYTTLCKQLFSGDNFLPLFIKLQFVLGIRPNKMFSKYIKKLFYKEIYFPFIFGYYEDKYYIDESKKMYDKKKSLK